MGEMNKLSQRKKTASGRGRPWKVWTWEVFTRCIWI